MRVMPFIGGVMGLLGLAAGLWEHDLPFALMSLAEAGYAFRVALEVSP